MLDRTNFYAGESFDILIRENGLACIPAVSGISGRNVVFLRSEPGEKQGGTPAIDEQGYAGQGAIQWSLLSDARWL